MSIKQLQTPSSLDVLAHTLRTLGQIFLLILAWSVFLLWSLFVTESLLIPWLAAWVGKTSLVNQILSSCIGEFLLAFGLVMLSLMLFFYRVPRTQEKSSVPLEFAFTTLCFIALHLLVMGVVLPWTEGCSPVSTQIVMVHLLLPDWLSTQLCQDIGVGVAFTVLSLIILFGLQGTTQLGQIMKQKRNSLVITR